MRKENTFNPDRRVHAFFSLMLLVLISGCTMGPDYQRPDIGVTPPECYKEAPISSDDAGASTALHDRWWKDFEDEALNQWVQEVLSRNWDIRKAAARIVEFQSRFIQSRSDRLPEIGVEGGVHREYRYLPVDETYRQKMSERFNLSLAVAYEIDLWGRLSRSTEAARGELLQAEENRIAVIHSIVAETVNTYLEMEALERRIQLARSTIENYQRALVLVEGRYQRGLSDVLAVRQARRALANAEAQMPSLLQELGETQQKIALLAGRYPETSAPRRQPEAYFQRLDAVPPGLPSMLLRRRPDIRAAEAVLQAANARIGEARANRFPSISLTGSLGYVSTDLDDLLLERGRFVNGGIDLLAPLFDAGRRKAIEDATRAQYQQAVAAYADTLLTAFGEVEGALLRREKLLEKRERILKLVDEARLTLDASETRYTRGVGSYLNVLEAQRSRYLAEESLVLTDLAILTNRVGLYRALGGGWGDADAFGAGSALESVKK